jgi:F-type H+-transporting ATPase subunit a
MGSIFSGRFSFRKTCKRANIFLTFLTSFPFFHRRPLIFAPNFGTGMYFKSFKSLLAAVFGAFLLFFSTPVLAGEGAVEGKLDPAKVIMEHIKDAHEFHFFTLKNADGSEFHATIPLPVILYSPERGWSVFLSSAFHHGHEPHDGYLLHDGKIHAVDANGNPDHHAHVYDLSITKNVVQMILALTILVVLLLSIAGRYKKGQGVTTAPKGWQNAVEPVITFVRDEVAKPNLGHNAAKYLPYLLTVFFFILINNLFGLIPGSANVTGNIAFTIILGVISFFVILFSTNKHFWGHIFWYPGVPVPVRLFIMLPVELLGVFTKPFALIVRLFANMVAGHIIILSFVTLIFIFGSMSSIAGWGFSPLSIAFAVFIYLIEIMVAFIQAFIFTNLTAVFIGQAREGEHHDEAHH